MNPIVFALRHPITMIMLVVALVGGGALALTRMRIDIFPPINQPSIYVFTNYGGYDPYQMEGLLVSPFEFWFQFVDGVRNMESKSIQQVAVIELSFYPDTDMSKAMAQVVSVASRAQATQPDGTLPPLIMQMDAGNVPVGYLVFKSKTRSLGEIGDLALYRVKPLLQTYVPGTVSTAPYGSSIRAITVSVDPDKLRSYNLTPNDVVDAINGGNTISPSGNLYIQGAMPLTPTNAMIRDPKVFGSIPIKPGRNVYLRDVATVADATDINYGYGLVDGRKSIYVPIIKKDTASTLTVVSNIKKAMPVFKSALPEDVDIDFAFDESPTVVTAVKNVATEGAIGAGLTGLMILLFLRDWRSVIVVVFNIPMALLGSLCGLWLTGNTINIMTLGGLALAIGILVDEATVEIENIHVQMGRTPSLSRAVLNGNHITAVPRLLALLCILSVFIPAFLMAEPVRSLFVPLALAVGFAMVSSYVLSSTIVPVLSVWLLKHHGNHEDAHPSPQPPPRSGEGEQGNPSPQPPPRSGEGEPESPSPSASGGEGLGVRGVLSRVRLPAFSFARVQAAFGAAVGWLVGWRWVVVPAYLVVCAALLLVLGTRLGTELFPQVDSGEFVIRFRAPPGSDFEITRQIWAKSLQVIQEEAGAENVDIGMGFAGQVSPLFSINNLILFMRGPDDGQMRVALREDSGIHLQPFRERLRKALPEKVKPWLADLLQKQGLTQASGAGAGRADDLRLRAGRHGQRGDELRLTGPHRGRRRQPEPVRLPRSRGTDHDGDEEDPVAARCEVPAGAGLPDGARGDRPRARRPERRDRPAGGQRRGGDFLLQPLRRPQLLGRSEERHQLPGPGRGPHAADELAGATGDGVAGAGHPRPEPVHPRRGPGGPGHHAGGDRPHQQSTLRERHRQRRRDGPRPRCPADRAGHRRRGRPPAGRPCPDARPGGAHERDVPRPDDRPGRGGGGDPGAPDRLL